MIVMKFGGTSVADCAAISRTIEIIRKELPQKPVVVVSALSKVTDLLYKIAEQARLRNTSAARELLSGLRERHIMLAKELISPESGLVEGMSDNDILAILEQAKSRVNSLCDRLEHFVEAVCELGELSDRSQAVIIGNGEYLSSNVICCAMNARGIRTRLMDSRRMIITDNEFLKGEPQTGEIETRVQREIGEEYRDCDAVITQGFVSATADGEPTVLGRGGSDYTASLIGMAIGASRIEIWTDVDGVKTADPRKVQNTKSLDKISFEEAAEMAHFGAKVLHPMTIEPAVKKNIPIYVLNSMNPEGKGTAILRSELIEDGVKSISSKQNILVINIFSTKMINTAGFLMNVFEIFSRNKVSVDLISTSEANISVTVDSAQNVDKVIEELSAFAQVYVDSDKSQVSVIGKNLDNVNGILEKTFGPLSRYRIYMISQGASYINISFVIDRPALDTVVSILHRSLFE